LALATLYYGGTAYSQAQANAKVSQIKNQAQQLLGAADLFYANKGRWPLTTQELVDERFLKSIPVAQTAMREALADASEWTMAVPEVPVFLLSTGIPEACRGINLVTGVTAPAGGFELATNTCTAGLAANQTCTISVRHPGVAPGTAARTNRSSSTTISFLGLASHTQSIVFSVEAFYLDSSTLIGGGSNRSIRMTSSTETAFLGGQNMNFASVRLLNLQGTAYPASSIGAQTVNSYDYTEFKRRTVTFAQVPPAGAHTLQGLDATGNVLAGAAVSIN
jgi:hypothetical protein